MQKVGNLGSSRLWLLVGTMLVLAVAAGSQAARSNGAPSAPAAKRVVVRETMNKKLGKNILVDLKGLTLYSLSAEKNGKFICTDAYCKSLWTPLVVAKGTTPSGAHLLATVKRPDGRTQVTYKGLPLYTFNEDSKPGDIKGNGFKDVGIWRPATPSGSNTSQSRPTQPAFRY
jgi:predicted lipoprotein with Yx(FWY)xxD motif